MAKRRKKQVDEEAEHEDEDLSLIDALLEKQFADTFAESLMLHEPSQLPDEGTELITWVKAQGWTPLEMLTHTYKNAWLPVQHRIAAAKAVLDYVHKKLPTQLKVEGSVDRRITADQLSRLTDEELSIFTKLLEKLEGGN